MRGTRTYCSSACPLSYAQANRHLLHTITAMGIWASPSRLTYAAENSHHHHQTLDIHAENETSKTEMMNIGNEENEIRHIAKLMNSRAQGPKNDDKSAVAMLKHAAYDRTVRLVVSSSSSTRQLGCVFQDMEPPKLPSILWKSSGHTETNPTFKNHESYCMSR